MAAKMEGMNTEKALAYLFHTYKQPYMKDKSIEGTNVLRDPYALGADGMERLDNLEKQAHDAFEPKATGQKKAFHDMAYL